MKLRIVGTYLKIEFRTFEKILACHGSWTISFNEIKSITTSIPQNSWWDLRAPGTLVPGVIKAGTYYTKRGKEFWYAVRGSERGFFQIELKENSYKWIILLIKDNEKWAHTITSLLDKDV